MTLTREEILSEPAGPRLNGLMLYYVFGWRWRKHLIWDVSRADVRRGVKSAETHTLLAPPGMQLDWLSEPLDGFYEWLPYALDGWERWFCSGKRCDFSKNIEAAWRVVEKIQESDFRMTLSSPGSFTDEGLGGGSKEGMPWEVYLAKPYPEEHMFASGPDHDTSVLVSAMSAPLAICRAALLARLSESP